VNDQDPLAQLRDIHIPEAAGLWPPAPGWWILAFLIIAGLTFYIVKRIQDARNNRYRADAVKALDSAWQQLSVDSNTHEYLLTLTQILKRTALTAYPSIRISRFHGRAWLAFLDDTLADKTFYFLQGPGQSLIELPYQETINDADLKPIHDLGKRWCLDHLPEKVLVKPNFKAKSQTYSEAQHVTT